MVVINYSITEIVNTVDKQLPAVWSHTRENRPYHGFIYLQNGCIRYCDSRESVQIEVDEMLYLEEGSSYTLTSESRQQPEYIIVNFRIGESAGQPPLRSVLGRKIVPRDKLAMSEAFRKINESYFFMPTGYRLEIRSLLYEILYSALHASIMNNVTGEERRLLPAVQKMRKSFDKPYDITALAELCSLSPSHFRKLFHDYYGISPRDYLLKLRIERAKSLLRESDLPIGVIAEKTGWSDNAYFCKMFRLLSGKTPGQYRQSEGTRR